MTIRTLIVSLAASLLLAAGCTEDDPILDDDDVTDDDDDDASEELVVTGARMVVSPEGFIDIHDDAGDPIVLHGVGSLKLDHTGEDGVRLATDGPDRERTLEVVEQTTPMGTAPHAVLTVAGAEGEPDLVWTIGAYEDRGFFTFQLQVDNTTGGELALAKSAGLEVRWEDDGGVFLGQYPDEHRILDNGSYAALDFIAQVHPGDTEFDEGYYNLVPGHFEAHVVSTGNHAVTDLGCDGEDAPGSCGWVAGALSFDASSPTIGLSHNPLIAPEADDGRLGFHYFSAESAWLPYPTSLADGESRVSELYYVNPVASDARYGLEQYAEVLAEALEVQPWHRREEGRRVPNGWNSGAGAGGTGGYGTDIDEDVMLENLDIMATELRDWGIDWFQMDDGYEPYYGDWYEWLEERFPNGPAWLSQQIRDAGLIPGLWMAPFTAHPDSQIVADHPDWFLEPLPLGVAVIGDSQILDLNHPEVLAYLDDLFTTFHEEWGFEWLKLDFGYHALFGEEYYGGVTREEAWRNAMTVIREALGEDAFFLIIGQMGPNLDIADAGRLTLDTMPVWDREPGQTLTLEEAGLKPSSRTFTRRWYVQDRVWINHPDLFFFRSNTLDETWPRLTHEESRTLCTSIALSGGIVKLGDRLVDLDGDGINVIRTMIPTYPTPATPLDVFEREFAEVLLQRVDAPLDGFTEPYHVLGLFHWGENTDLSVNPYEDIDDTDADRHHVIDLAAEGLEGEYLAYEFWTGEFLGPVSGELSYDVPSHDSRVIALREPLDRPQFLGWNRQITMGGTALGDVTWDGSALTIPMDAAVPTELAPFTYEVAVHVPDGFTFADVTSDGVDLEGLAATVDGEVVRVTFVPLATGDLTLTLDF